MKDPIVDEVRQAREDYAEKFNFDLDAICEDLRKSQGKEGRTVVSLPPKKSEPEASRVAELPTAKKPNPVMADDATFHAEPHDLSNAHEITSPFVLGVSRIPAATGECPRLARGILPFLATHTRIPLPPPPPRPRRRSRRGGGRGELGRLVWRET